MFTVNGWAGDVGSTRSMRWKADRAGQGKRGGSKCWWNKLQQLETTRRELLDEIQTARRELRQELQITRASPEDRIGCVEQAVLEQSGHIQTLTQRFDAHELAHRSGLPPRT